MAYIMEVSLGTTVVPIIFAIRRTVVPPITCIFAIRTTVHGTLPWRRGNSNWYLHSTRYRLYYVKNEFFVVRITAAICTTVMWIILLIGTTITITIKYTYWYYLIHRE